MKRLLIFLALILPGLILGFLALFPQYDRVIAAPLPHFYVVTFTTFSAAVISILLLTVLGPATQLRHRLAAVAFAFIGAIFFTHGFATPGVLLETTHPMVQWSSWITLFVGGGIFFLASLDGPHAAPGWLSVRRISLGALGLVSIYLIVAVLFPQVLDLINTRAAPWHRFFLFAVTLLLWVGAAFKLWRTYRVTHKRADGALAFVAFWLGWATISMHEFASFRLSWWVYHFVLLISFLFTAYILLREYEQAREFRLLPYYMTVSLIVTAFLALLASGLFAEFAYRNLVAQIESSAQSMIGMMTREMADGLPPDVSPVEARSIVSRNLAQLGLANAWLYDANGSLVYPLGDYGDETGAVLDRNNFAQALQGQILSEVHPPNDPPAGYTAVSNQYAVQTYAPIYPAAVAGHLPIGVLVTVEAVDGLGQVLIDARVTGLLIAALTMGVLFVTLLFVVRRADRIITTRARELEIAYANLRASESIRNDLTSMIVHDLRNPLTAVIAGLDLIERTADDGQSELRERFIGNVRAAALRMTTLIDDMLSVSKIESGELRPERKMVELGELLADRVGGFTAQAAAQGKQLSFKCDEDLSVAIDAELIGRVVDNLISNAFKYTEETTGAIQVFAQRENGRVLVHVQDNGEGVPDDYKDKIFAKFVQAPDTKRSLRKGTGLGLAFCRLVVEAHAGEIKVQDAPSGGSDFVFWLPA